MLFLVGFLAGLHLPDTGSYLPLFGVTATER